MTKNILAALVSMLAVSNSAKKCPEPTSMQSDEVKSNFNMESFLGTYYEIAYHDYTQPIGVCGCQRSVKTFQNERIYDDFTLNCGNSKGDNTHSKTYHNNLNFGLTN